MTSQLISCISLPLACLVLVLIITGIAALMMSGKIDEEEDSQ